MDKLGYVYVTGIFSGTVDFDPSTSVFNLNSEPGHSIFFAKYDECGRLIFAKTIGCGGGTVNGMKVDENGNVYLTGQIINPSDFDPDSGEKILTSNGSFDIFIAKYNSNGALVFAYNLGA